MTPLKFCPATLRLPGTAPDKPSCAAPGGKDCSGIPFSLGGQGPAREWGGVRLAAPSWVIPGTIWENCQFLAGKVDEVGLLFFDTAASLAYGPADLPPDLVGLGLAFHVHLPGNLPWDKGGEAVATLCLALMDKVTFLGVQRAVLHPPPEGATAAGVLDAFAAAWRAAGKTPGSLLLENTRENDLGGLWPCIEQNGFGLCLDLGHMLAYAQKTLHQAAFTGELPRRLKASMIHYNAPGTGAVPVSGHAPLDSLDAEGCRLGRAVCSLLAADGVAMAELFSWEHVVRSLPLMDSWLRRS